MKTENMRCLTTKTCKLETAEEDIKCFKTFQFRFDDNNFIHLRTPYNFVKLTKRVVRGEKDFVARGNVDIIGSYKIGEYFVYDCGLIHTYKLKSGAKQRLHNGEIVISCIIPKGTEYIKGIDSCGYKTFASKKIRIAESIESITKKAQKEELEIQQWKKW